MTGFARAPCCPEHRGIERWPQAIKLFGHPGGRSRKFLPPGLRRAVDGLRVSCFDRCSAPSALRPGPLSTIATLVEGGSSSTACVRQARGPYRAASVWLAEPRLWFGWVMVRQGAEGDGHPWAASRRLVLSRPSGFEWVRDDIRAAGNGFHGAAWWPRKNRRVTCVGFDVRLVATREKPDSAVRMARGV